VDINPALVGIDAIGKTVTAALGTIPTHRPNEAEDDIRKGSLANAAE
jgi:hypothetical protein